MSLRCFLVLGLALSAPLSAAGIELSAGQWETEARFTSVEGSGPHASATRRIVGMPQTKRECLTATALADRFAEFRKPGCKMARSIVANGHIDIAGQCREGSRVKDVRVTGSYTPTSYTLSTTMGLADGGTAVMTAKGRRLGACSDAD